MKKITTSVLITLSLILAFSCGKDDDPVNNDPIVSDNTPLPVEEGKKQLEENSIEMMTKIDEFHNDSALNEIVELAEFFSSSNATNESTGAKKAMFITLENIASVKASNDVTLFNAKQAVSLVEEPTLVDDFNEQTGMYQWNESMDDFEKTGESTDIIYTVSYNGKTATFSFTDFETTVAGNANSGQEEIPTLIRANLKVGETIVFSQDFSASFQTGELIPATINNTTTIGGFAFETSYTNPNNTSITQDFNFKIYDTVIIGYSVAANGNFNTDNLDNENNDGPEDIFDNVSTTFQFMGAKLSITANDTDLDSSNDLTVDQAVILLNKNVNAELSINNRLIASSLFYKDQDTYIDYEYNYNTYTYDETEVTEDIVNVQFLFSDGTSSDFETYIDGSFTELENKMETVFTNFENLFADVNME